MIAIRVLPLLVCAALLAGCGGSGGDAGASSASPAPKPRALTVAGRRRVDARLDEWTLRTNALREPTHVRVLVPAGYRASAAP